MLGIGNCISLSTKIFTGTLPATDVKFLGLYFKSTFTSCFLKTDISLTSFQSCGTLLIWTDWLKVLVRDLSICFSSSLTYLGVRLSCHVEWLMLRVSKYFLYFIFDSCSFPGEWFHSAEYYTRDRLHVLDTEERGQFFFKIPGIGYVYCRGLTQRFHPLRDPCCF